MSHKIHIIDEDENIVETLIYNPKIDPRQTPGGIIVYADIVRRMKYKQLKPGHDWYAENSFGDITIAKGRNSYGKAS